MVKSQIRFEFQPCHLTFVNPSVLFYGMGVAIAPTSEVFSAVVGMKRINCVMYSVCSSVTLVCCQTPLMKAISDINMILMTTLHSCLSCVLPLSCEQFWSPLFLELVLSSQLKSNIYQFSYHSLSIVKYRKNPYLGDSHEFEWKGSISSSMCIVVCVYVFCCCFIFLVPFGKFQLILGIQITVVVPSNCKILCCQKHTCHFHRRELGGSFVTLFFATVYLLGPG